MKRIAIVDYGLCNLDSVARAVEVCGSIANVTQSAADMEEADGIILPGVGSFPEAMDELDRLDLIGIIRQVTLKDNRPFIGICLGMQLMVESGTENRPRTGLGLIPGTVERLKPSGHDTRIPHIGWNIVNLKNPHPLFNAIPDGRDFYFVHSYHVVTQNEFIIATTPYGNGFTSVIGRNTIIGAQFHPEKSLKYGLKLLANFLELC